MLDGKGWNRDGVGRREKEMQGELIRKNEEIRKKGRKGRRERGKSKINKGKKEEEVKK